MPDWLLALLIVLGAIVLGIVLGLVVVRTLITPLYRRD